MRVETLQPLSQKSGDGFFLSANPATLIHRLLSFPWVREAGREYVSRHFKWTLPRIFSDLNPGKKMEEKSIFSHRSDNQYYILPQEQWIEINDKNKIFPLSDGELGVKL